MGGMQPNPEAYAFVTSFSPVPMAQTVANLRRGLRAAIFSTLISLAITAFIWWRSRPVEGTLFWVLIAFIVLALLNPIITLVRIWRANRILTKVGQGAALRIDPAGLVLTNADGYQRVPWDQVDAVTSKLQHRLPGSSLVVRRRGDTKKTSWRVPFAFLDTLPGSIDSAVRAHTSGETTLDLRPLDRVF